MNLSLSNNLASELKLNKKMLHLRTYMAPLIICIFKHRSSRVAEDELNSELDCMKTPTANSRGGEEYSTVHDMKYNMK